MRTIEPQDLLVRPFRILDQEWALLVAGRNEPNPMTISWGGLGTLWDRPVATVYVRPVRRTYELLEAHPEFTLNFLPAPLRAALEFCGAHSGRDTDKWRATGLTPAPSAQVAVPRVSQAVIALECRVLTTLDLDPSRFLDKTAEEFYPEADYHRLFIGDVVAAWAEDQFAQR